MVSRLLALLVITAFVKCSCLGSMKRISSIYTVVCLSMSLWWSGGNCFKLVYPTRMNSSNFLIPISLLSHFSCFSSYNELSGPTGKNAVYMVIGRETDMSLNCISPKTFHCVVLAGSDRASLKQYCFLASVCVLFQCCMID